MERGEVSSLRGTQPRKHLAEEWWRRREGQVARRGLLRILSAVGTLKSTYGSLTVSLIHSLTHPITPSPSHPLISPSSTPHPLTTHPSRCSLKQGYLFMFPGAAGRQVTLGWRLVCPQPTGRDAGNVSTPYYCSPQHTHILHLHNPTLHPHFVPTASTHTSRPHELHPVPLNPPSPPHTPSIPTSSTSTHPPHLYDPLPTTLSPPHLHHSTTSQTSPPLSLTTNFLLHVCSLPTTPPSLPPPSSPIPLHRFCSFAILYEDDSNSP